MPWHIKVFKSNGTHATAGRVQGIVFGSQAEAAQNVPMSNGRETPRDMVQDNKQLTPVDPALRLVAYLIDWGIFVLILVVLIFMTNAIIFLVLMRSQGGGGPSASPLTSLVMGLLILLLPVLCIVIWGYFWTRSTSVGKFIMGLYVIDSKTEQPLGLGYMILRETIGKLIISPWIFSLGFIWILLDKDKQGWHDKLVSSIVVRRPQK